ncbi:MAG: putative sulfate/molybdate transporter [Nitrospirota bacterium]
MRDSGIPSDNFRKLAWDISGAFGDIGVLFPIAIALIVKNGFNPTALFLMAGLFYVISAYYFRITMPVQPLKAMSAIAIASGLNFEVINAAGIAMGIILIFISLTRLSVKLGSFFPVSVIRGIQLGLGMMLVRSASGLISADILIAVVAGLLLITNIALIKKIPPLIPILILGAVFSIRGLTPLAIGPVALSPALPDADSLWRGFTLLVLPQIALTFGNAIVATEATGKLLYGQKAERLSLQSVPLSMGFANITSGFFGGAPMCHGCGGLTAHSKFGATSERSGYIIGGLLIVLALLFGKSALSIISAFPLGILGVLLCYVGIQHSLFIRDIIADKKAVFVALTVAVSGFLTNNLTVGFVLGLGVHYSFTMMKNTLRI